MCQFSSGLAFPHFTACECSDGVWRPVEALRAYFDLREGRPTAESVAEKLCIPVRTVRNWLADNANDELLDEIVPL